MQKAIPFHSQKKALATFFTTIINIILIVMTNNLLKTLFVAVALLTAGTVWAEQAEVKMTYVRGSDDSVDTSYGEVSTVRIGYLKIVDNQVELAYKEWNENNIAYLRVDASAISGNISKATLKATVTGSADGNRGAGYGVGFNTSEWKADLTWNTADRTITKLTSSEIWLDKGQEKDIELDITEAFAGDEDKVVTIIAYQVNPGGGNFSNPTVEIEAVEGAVAQYRILYTDLEGNELKDPRMVSGLVGTIPTYKDEDIKPIYVNGEKYILQNISDAFTIDQDGSTELVLEFRLANLFSYTLTNQFGEVIVEGTDYEGETAKVPFPRFTYEPGTNTLLEAASYSKEYLYPMTLDADGATGTVEYKQGSINNVIYYTELENIVGMTETTGYNHGVRCSNGAGAYNADEGDVYLTALPPGKYNIHVGIRGTSVGTILNVLVGDQTLECEIKDGNFLDVSFDVTLTADAEVLIPEGGGSANNCYDYIYIRELPNATYDFVVMSSVGDFEISGFGYAGEKAMVPFPQYINVDGTLYTKPAIGKEYNYTFELYMGGQEEELEYVVAERQVPTGGVDANGNPITEPEEIHDVIFYSEAEDIEGTTVVTNGYANIRCSMSAGAYNAGEEPLYITTLEPGTYNISAQVWGNSGVTFTLTAGTKDLIIDTQGYIWGGNTDIVIATPTDLVMQPQPSGGNGKCIDWILVTGQVGGSTTGIADINRSTYNVQRSTFNLQGQRVAHPSKGIFLIGGKKVIK